MPPVPKVAALSPAAEQAMAAIDSEKIRAHVKFLSHDLLEGRGTGQRGGDVAAQYIAAQFALYGLKPAGDNGTYLQKVPMVGITDRARQHLLASFPPRASRSCCVGKDDIVAMDETGQPSTTIDAPIVWIGYGIDAPEFNWNDYKGVDVKGKVLLMLVNEPPSDDPKFFAGPALTYYGRWTYKYEQAARMGAVGVLLIHKTEMASYGWDVVRNSWSGERSYLRSDSAPKLKMASWIQQDIARKLAQDCGKNLDDMMAAAAKPGFKAEPLPARFKAHIVSQVRPFDSNNVVAVLPGSDPKLKDQGIVYSAHYDHFGIVPGMAGDNIFNGAQDNATGVAIVLEIARVLRRGQNAAQALHLLCVGHRRGAGSARLRIFRQASAGSRQGAFARTQLRRHPAAGRPARGQRLRRRAHHVLSHGREHGQGLRARHHSRPQSQRRTLLPLRPLQPGARGRARVLGGQRRCSTQGHDRQWGIQKAKDYVTNDYHHPSDEYHPDMDFRTDADIARFGVALGWQAANQTSEVGWKSGDEFDKPRKASGAQ